MDNIISNYFINYNFNYLPNGKYHHWLILFFIQLTKKFNLILIICAIIIFLKFSKHDAILILLTVLANTIFDTRQELKSQKETSLIKEKFNKKYLIKRDKHKIKLNLGEIKVGDLIYLDSNELVPADCIILEKNNLTVDQSVFLNYEPLNNLKIQQKLYQGYFILSGSCVCQVIAIGHDTLLNNNKNSVINSESTPLQKDLKDLQKIIYFMIVISCLAIFILGWLHNKNIKELLLLTTVLFISLIPKGLQAIISLIFIREADYLKKHQIFVQNSFVASSFSKIEIIIIDDLKNLSINDIEKLLNLKIKFIFLTEPKNLAINFIQAKNNQEVISKMQKNNLIYLKNSNFEDNYELIKKLQELDYTVLFYAKNINDIALIKKADIGIVTPQSDELTQNSADIIINNHILKKILLAIKISSQIFYEFKNIVVYYFSENLAEVFLSFFSVVSNSPFLINASQLLWINIISDGFIDAAMVYTNQDSKQNHFNEKIITKNDFWFILQNALIMFAGTLLIYILNRQQDPNYLQTLTFNTFVSFQIFNAINCKFRKTKLVFGQLKKNYYLLLVLILVVVLQTIITYNILGNNYFETVPLKISDFIKSILIGSLILLPKLLVKKSTI
jgi:magnesium-transporting ATPase (P-type)